jgi:hypothetical protein
MSRSETSSNLFHTETVLIEETAEIKEVLEGFTWRPQDIAVNAAANNR